jgi:glutathione synthase/RimK-type ligase-like ATP-grasp enzyme
MKIAIHIRRGSYSDEWVNYCINYNISYIAVNCYDNDIINQIKDCDALIWHHHEADWQEAQFAKPILHAIEQSGIKVYPNFKTDWHYDNKVAQKYLLEGIGAPLVPSFVFYNKQHALSWIKKSSFPIVFKLKGGAGSSNVKLVHNELQAKKIISKAFGRGFSVFNRIAHLKERFRRVMDGQEGFSGLLKGIARLIIGTPSARNTPREKKYIYFQEFIPNNDFDVRIVVVKDKAVGERRFVRKGDFRASGSGAFDYEGVDTNLVKIAFHVADTLMLQSAAFDFIYKNGEPLIVEMSYAFGVKGILKAPGYWDKDLVFHNTTFDPRIWIIENIIMDINS